MGPALIVKHCQKSRFQHEPHAKLLDEREVVIKRAERERPPARGSGGCSTRRGHGRSVMWEVVVNLDWAVTLYEECVVRSASSGRNNSFAARMRDAAAGTYLPA